MSLLLPADHIFWSLPKTTLRQLKADAQADVVVIGGGMVGLSAAQHFKQKGCSVILLEKTFCGAGASGKSSGFVTPHSEFSLGSFVERYGKESAHHIWEFVLSGVERIRHNIETYNLSCDYHKQDSLVVASTPEAFTKEIKVDFETHIDLGYEGTLYTKDELSTIIGSDAYFGALRYSNTFGINGYQYLQGLKEVLVDQGVAIYEETPVLSFTPHRVRTPSGTVSAHYIVVCADRWIPDFNKLVYDIYHAQNFLILSAPLTDKQIATIFPRGPMMTWDTDFIYQYYRVVMGNRLLVGGGSMLYTYASHASHDNNHVFNKLRTYIKEKFMLDITFEYMWPGLIGVSKDILPLIGRDTECETIYYVAATAGLPWATALGRYAADALLDGRSDVDEFFYYKRQFNFGPVAQKILGKQNYFCTLPFDEFKEFLKA